MGILQGWQEFLRNNRERFIGGEIQHDETPEGAFRGPISDIVIVGDTLTITTEWIAHVPLRGGFPMGNWEKAEDRPLQYTIADDFMSGPQPIGEGRVIFQYPFSLVTLFPKDGSKLDPRRVKGL